MTKRQCRVDLKLENDGGLWSVAGTNTCLGSLMHFEGHGVYEPNFGRVPVPEDAVDKHNEVLDDMLVAGFANCEVGQGGSFYVVKPNGRYEIRTFTGKLVSDQCRVVGRTLTFVRDLRSYRGRLSLEHDLFNFRRVR